jgi:hypothetical protein
VVVYGFKSEFAPLVASGQKVHTIRDLRKDDRHAKPGSKLQLYSGLRTKNCLKLVDPDPICWQVFDIETFSGPRIVSINKSFLAPHELHWLITGDGFKSATDFWEFFSEDRARKLICWAEVQWLKRLIVDGE